jgi:alcohol dehydrogenase class IV
VIRFNAAPGVKSTELCASMYSDLSKIVFRGSAAGSSDVYEKSEEFASLFENLSKDLKIPCKLAEVGITESSIELLATEAMKQTRLLPNNPREVKLADAVRIYGNAL